MQSHGGNIKKCNCIARFFYVPALCCKVRIMQYKKMPMTMVTTGSLNPVQNKSRNILTPSILMMHHPLPLSWPGAPTLRLPSNNFLKKHPFSPEFMECVNLLISTHRQEKQGHFWPCQLWSFTPLIITECKRQGVYFGVKTMWDLCISPIFTQNCHKTLTIFCVIFPNAAKNTQQSTKKEGEVKAIGGE